jgi:hypothetical protein
VFLVFDLLRPVVGRAGIGVGVRDRPAGPTAERPEVLDVDAAPATATATATATDEVSTSDIPALSA